MELHKANTKNNKNTESNQNTIKDHMDGNTVCYLVKNGFQCNYVFHIIGFVIGYIVLCVAS